MDLNASKCHVLSISRKQKPVLFPYTISGAWLERVRHHPYLGVELSSDLNWGAHLDISIPKAQRSLNLLRQNLNSCSSSTKELAYKTLVQPVLEYAGSAWDPHQADHIQRLEKVQRRAARFVSGLHDRAVSLTNIMAGLGWRSLQERRLESRLCMFYKTVNGTSTCNSPAYIQPHSTSLRASHDQQCRVPHTTNPIDAYTYSFSLEPSEYGIYCQLPLYMQAPSNDLRMDYTRNSYPEICMWLAQGDNTTDPGWGVPPACQWLVPYTNHLYPWCI